MKNCEIIELKGWIAIERYNREGYLIDRTEANNSIVMSGRDLVAKQFLGISADPISHIAVGTGIDKVQAGDLELGKELFRKPLKPVDPSLHLTFTDDNRRKVFLSAELNFFEGNGALTEAALFNADTNGIMYNRVVFPTVNKTSDFKLTLIWEIIF
jgi:hypothetical protein